MKKEQMCWGLIGAGDVCEKKAGPPLYELPGHSLLAVTRRDREKGEDFARRHGNSRYVPDVASLLAVPEINAVYVATPPGVHAEQAIAAAEAGKAVLVEKPMAMNAAECARMVAACRANGVMLGVAYYRRGYPSVQRALALIESGRIGALKAVWMNDQFPPSHRLDLVHAFCGNFASVRVETREAGAVLHAVSERGCAIRMNLGWNEHPGQPEQVRLRGETGEIFIEDLKGGSFTGSVAESFAPLPWTHWGLIENFGEAFRGRSPLLCDGEEGRKSTVILDWVSAIEPDLDPVAVDYAHPPEANPERAKRWNLLG
ncbi:MAG: Gfo/Idh/MocA family oxidoreductase [Verrucomicrobia bacterium]|nr:Gfo/Idh/MocA family oxidoreductase [Verrucomicrobiota bacterium]MCH8526560.1 Gfo/Idh/MocA family oxidoreductase [Kiritimatiellia bacterium]